MLEIGGCPVPLPMPLGKSEVYGLACQAERVGLGALRPDRFLTWANFSTIFGSDAVLVIVTLGLSS